MFHKMKAPIKEGVNLKEILKIILVEEIQVISKELWTVAPKLWAVLKEVLTSKIEKRGSDEDAQKRGIIQPVKEKTVSVNALDEPEKI